MVLDAFDRLMKRVRPRRRHVSVGERSWRSYRKFGRLSLSAYLCGLNADRQRERKREREREDVCVCLFCHSEGYDSCQCVGAYCNVSSYGKKKKIRLKVSE